MFSSKAPPLPRRSSSLQKYGVRTCCCSLPLLPAVQKLKTQPMDAVRKAVVRQVKLTIAGKVTTKMFFKLFERSVRSDPEFAVDMLDSVAEVLPV
jgi:NADH:ubiquinone oxidoreductase subunit B-like Fe-S oxidoreductase